MLNTIKCPIPNSPPASNLLAWILVVKVKDNRILVVMLNTAPLAFTAH